MERWVDIPGWEGYYKVSSFGRVKALPRETEFVCRWGVPAIRRFKEKLIKPRNISGYSGVGLNKPNEERKQYYVHSLVLEAFVGPRPEGMQACHFDGNKKNNHLSNLRWDTPQSNSDDRKRHGSVLLGSRHPNAKLTEEEVLDIRRRVIAGELLRCVADDYSVSETTIWSIKHAAKWKNLLLPQESKV